MVKPLYASFGHRLSAHFADFLLFLLLIAMVAFMLLFPTLLLGFFSMASTVTITLFTFGLWIGGTLLIFVLHWLYYAGFESSPLMATPGKLLLGLRVCSENGTRLSLWQATIRYFGRHLSTLLCYFGYLMALFTLRNQALHDLLSHSLVLKTEPAKTPSQRLTETN